MIESCDEYDTRRTLCRLLQTSRSIRDAMQQSGVCCKAVLGLASTSSEQAVTSFAAWLTQHSGLLQELTVYGDDASSLARENMVSMALQLYSARAAACAHAGRPALAEGQRDPASTAACATAWAAHASAQLPVGLQKVTWSFMQTPAVLQALQAAPKLTELQLSALSKTAVTPSMLAALGRLTTLHSFEFSIQGKQSCAAMCADALCSLSRLTRLEGVRLHGSQVDALRMLSTSLCALTVTLMANGSETADSMESQEVPCAALSRLVSLHVTWEGDRVMQVTLPTTLTHLWLEGHLEAPVVPDGLQHAGVTNPALCMDLFTGLSALTALDAVTMFFNEQSPATLASLLPVVSELPRLTGLTRLSVDNDFERLPDEVCTAAGFGRGVAALTGLRDLHFNQIELAEADALHLSVLTALTKLHVFDGGDGVSDMVVSSIALCLTKLRVLDLRFCGLKTQAAFPVIAALPELRDLSLYGNDVVVNDTGLLRFSSSTSLTKLGFPEEVELTDEGEKQFHASMPQYCWIWCW